MAAGRTWLPAAFTAFRSTGPRLRPLDLLEGAIVDEEPAHRAPTLEDGATVRAASRPRRQAPGHSTTSHHKGARTTSHQDVAPRRRTAGGAAPSDHRRRDPAERPAGAQATHTHARPAYPETGASGMAHIQMPGAGDAPIPGPADFPGPADHRRIRRGNAQMEEGSR
ncbi:hypothetical protein Psi02_02990 [Planotetraspora silvatica]|uniref:Uncharacterized protein n=1 Tax=Planotetraspora silvatica TaxID=234614 RepID=A0A8J3USM3_9ACTN|nr:hypothetical protein Psi02_02990 [Planotetraspora silvatica]